MSTVHIRVSDTTKEAVRKIFEKLGLDMSTAIKLYFHQVMLHKGLPFPLLTENGFTPEEEDSILKAIQDAEQGKNVTKAMEPKDALVYLKKL